MKQDSGDWHKSSNFRPSGNFSSANNARGYPGGPCIRPDGRRGVFSRNRRLFPHVPSLHGPARHIRIKPGKLRATSGESPLNNNTAPSTGIRQRAAQQQLAALAWLSLFEVRIPKLRTPGNIVLTPRRTKGNAFGSVAPFVTLRYRLCSTWSKRPSNPETRPPRHLPMVARSRLDSDIFGLWKRCRPSTNNPRTT
jgi:hypothetical protein